MLKKLSVLFMIFLFSTTINAQESYQNLWEQVHNFEKDNLPKSALKIVDDIYTKAQLNDNSQQIVKCLLYKSKFTLILEEDSQLKVVEQFKKHIVKSNFPTKNILQNILGTLYWQYFNKNRWKFYNRTQTATKVDKNDFRTWDLNTLFKEIQTYYKASLTNKTQLQQISSRKYSDIMELTKDSEKYRPTLYDFLAHSALVFFKTDENNITKPAYQFKIDNESYLSNSNEFSTINLNTKDDTSLQFNALKIYQDLTQFHIKNKNLDALAIIDLERLDFVKQHATFENKSDCYLDALKANESNYASNNISSLYGHKIAQIYSNQANKENKKLRFKKKEAIQICENYIKRFPKSLGAKRCASLKDEILYKNIRITAEEYSPIGKYQKVLISYKNIDDVYFSIFEVDDNMLHRLSETYDKKKKVKLIQLLTKVKTWNATLKNEFDYLEHSTEVIVPKLPQGEYILVASTAKEVSVETFNHISLRITNLAFIQNRVDGKSIYQIVDRITGKPIANAKVNLNNKHSYRRNNDKLNKNFTTNANGIFSFHSNKYYGNVNAIVKHNNDKASFKNFYINRSYDNKHYPPKTDEEIVLFTDRSIYRPGQKVFFKGILFEKRGIKASVLTDKKVKLFFKDVNRQELKDLELTTNEFGSFSGEFNIPEEVLTGGFQIYAKYNSERAYKNIRVEEYKRPKFEVAFNPTTKSFKLNDKVTLTGNAKAYSGASISDAKVTYRVHRKVQYPRWWYWYRPSFNSSPQEIKNGELTTDDSGNFTIEFDAKPDESVDKNSNPVFTYEVSADVTDLNGETRSTTGEVKVGYHSLIASIHINDEVNKAIKNQKITIDTKNLNGEDVSASGTLKIYKLQAPKRVLRKRPWNAPDYQVIPKAEFEQKFPYDSYTNEENYFNWKKGNLTYSEDFNTEKSKEITLKNIKKWESGKYIIELNTKDRFGEKVTTKTYFTLFTTEDKLPADNNIFSISTDKETYEIGDKAKITISSNSKDVTVMLFVKKNNTDTESHYIHLNKNKKTITVPVTKKDLGGFGISYYFINNNSFENGAKTIAVPYPKTDLEIITKTFRDKLQPGENQTWSFTIKGAKKDIVTSEVLASMYDASLDEFANHQWQFKPIYKPTFNSYSNTSTASSFRTNSINLNNLNEYRSHTRRLVFDKLKWFGFNFDGSSWRNRQYLSGLKLQKKTPSNILDEVVITTGFGNKKSKRGANELKMSAPAPAMMAKAVTVADEESESVVVANDTTENSKDKKESATKSVQIRKNLQETAFFYPHLTTDKNGDVIFNFTIPEALTKWKLQLLGHTKDLHSASKTLETVTQKELMVTPNAPRFLRQGDKIVISSKISNLSDKNLNGTAELILTDATNGKEINLLENSSKIEFFSVDKKKNTSVSWTLDIPYLLDAVQYKIVAKAGAFSDGEQNALPVLTNRMLVTESLPMWARSNQTKTFTLDKLKNNNSASLVNHKLTLEVTSNPAWYAVQALPYLMEYPYECSEQTFSRYYANTLASFVANSNPKIQEVFTAWKSSDVLLSSLEKNQELKSLLIQETPWLRDAQSETEQKKRIALLFDLNRMKNEQQRAIHKLKDNQMSNGGFPWFKGSRYPSVFITQHIATGFGHLNKLGVITKDDDTKRMTKKAVQFLDNELQDRYDELLKKAKKIKAKDGEKAYQKYLSEKHVGYFELQYLYMRSFYDDIRKGSNTQKAIDYYKKQAGTYWNEFNLYGKGLIALAQFRNGDNAIATKILASLRENSITSEELGMYWKENTSSWYWYQAPIETQSLLIEAFSEIENDTKTIDNLKIWLLKNKQVAQWKTTKATTEAVYALLLQGSDWISVTDLVDIKVGEKNVNPNKIPEVKTEAGSGYFKTSWNKDEITPEMGKVTISSKGKTISWGSLYWQYFEDLDKITSAETPLKLKKKLFKKVNSDTGKKLIPVTEKSELKVGDLLTTRIELRVDRAMEFIHMKDMRAAGVEPINVLSRYKWQDGLGYYESTKDASTNFFFDYLPKGVYVFEYDVRVNNAGDFSNGITTIESMYAPEFRSHSEGKRISVSTK